MKRAERKNPLSGMQTPTRGLTERDVQDLRADIDEETTRRLSRVSVERVGTLDRGGRARKGGR